jgi:hypothetical protein
MRALDGPAFKQSFSAKIVPNTSIAFGNNSPAFWARDFVL